MGFAEITAQQGIELPPPKTHAQRVDLQLNQPLELKCAFVIFAKMRMDPTAKWTAATMLRPDQSVACARHNSFATASENIRESPYVEVTA
jgi:hypothetical protein